ncbi:hypothetical protein CDD81_1772 [Ophiocordyceps australis]|uniref:Increased recombination centers protein 6 n=1 Tax=Ophiocordyceps australis TaxID=1399860 RepID=A0A2C5YDA4_9HYPO|nr:hypothetical protein CDD81_1772 [Ophiocordyceps australis]
MQVAHPRRVLAVSLDSQENVLSRAIKELTNQAPEATSSSLAGSTHDLPIKTSYYTATLPVWLDLVDDPEAWAASFLSDEAAEVLAALGAVVVVFGQGQEEQTKLLIRQVGRVLDEGLGGWEWDGVRLAVGFGDGREEEWEEICAEAGLEFVRVGEGEETLNEFGEKMGMARVKEALEANDWEMGADAEQFLDDEEQDSDSLDFGYDRADFEGLRQAIWRASLADDAQDAEADDTSTPVGRPRADSELEQGVYQPSGQEAKDGAGVDSKAQGAEKTDASSRHDGGAQQGGKDVGQELKGVGDDAAGVEGADGDDVDQVEGMMRRLQAVRDAGAGMGEAQRRRMAARAVAEVIKEL